MTNIIADAKHIDQIDEHGDSIEQILYVCRRCGETSRMVTRKCLSCKYRGKPSRKEYWMASTGALFIPILWLGIPFWVGKALIGKPKKGIAPFDDMTRREWHDASGGFWWAWKR